VSHSIDPASALGSANATTNATAHPVAFESVHPATESHLSTDEVEEVHPSPMRHPDAVAFEEPSRGNASAECDSLLERVGEPTFEGHLDLESEAKGPPPGWDELLAECDPDGSAECVRGQARDLIERVLLHGPGGLHPGPQCSQGPQGPLGRLCAGDRRVARPAREDTAQGLLRTRKEPEALVRRPPGLLSGAEGTAAA